MDYNNNDEFVIMFQLTLWSDDNQQTHRLTHTHIHGKNYRSKIIYFYSKCQNMRRSCQPTGEINIDHLLFYTIKYYNTFKEGESYNSLPIHGKQSLIIRNQLTNFVFIQFFGFLQGSFIRNIPSKRFSLSFKIYIPSNAIIHNDYNVNSFSIALVCLSS